MYTNCLAQLVPLGELLPGNLCFALVQETLDLLLQDNTRLLMQGELQDAGIDEKNLLCSKRAVVIGNKPSMFSGAGV